VVLKNEGMVFDHVTSPLPVVVGVGVFSCLMFHVKHRFGECGIWKSGFT